EPAADNMEEDEIEDDGSVSAAQSKRRKKRASDIDKGDDTISGFLSLVDQESEDQVQLCLSAGTPVSPAPADPAPAAPIASGVSPLASSLSAPSFSAPDALLTSTASLPLPLPQPSTAVTRMDVDLASVTSASSCTFTQLAQGGKPHSS